MTTDPLAAPFVCPACGEDRLVDGDAAAWYCQVCGRHGPLRLRLAAGDLSPVPSGDRAPDALQALLSVIVRQHLAAVAPTATWQVAAVAPLGKWPPTLQRDLTATLGGLLDPVVLVLERVPR